MPPAGVKPNYDASFLDSVAAQRNAGNDYANYRNNEQLATNYRYNSLNQVASQKSPDGGASHFWYDRLGRLVVSQNAKQAANGNYSYTQYDPLGRITEVGQKPQTTSMSQVISQDTTALQTWLAGGGLKEQITRTVYDVSYYAGESPAALEPTLYQQNLRNRVSYTQLIDQEPVNDIYAGAQSAATFYSYDIAGNVDTLVQDFNNAMAIPNRYKKIVYDYDLISGKVNKVSYQHGWSDQLYHRYSYDADNRLTNVEISHDSIYWENDAAYEYYRHGPLSRMILGQNQVQGLDYAYTIQGWLKGVNSTAVLPAFDMGGDGSNTSTVARDAFGFSLNYYNGDYKPIGSTAAPFVTVTNNLPVIIDGIHTGNDLFNGNIRAMLVNVPQLGNANLYAYRYDQLNRITAMNSFTGFGNSTNLFTNSNMPTSTENYKERVTYDPNGNIRTYLRNGDAARIAMDNLAYTYKNNSNQLDKVVDAATDAASGDYDKYNDIKQGQTNGNYQYDAIGNLISDASEGITNIDWNVYGKIKTITKSDGTEIDYSYDVSGNRINKKVTSGGVTKTTVYVRDASGNVMSIYTEDPAINSGHLTQTEADMYGSSRLGIWNMSRDVSALSAIDYSNYSSTFERGNKFFELSNHLGNVLATVDDKKVGVDTNSDGVVDYDTAEVVSANDYYPGGMDIPNRSYSIANTNYRYGFNGKEKDNKDGVVQYDYGFRIYDPRLVRFKSVDPLAKSYPWNSPYSYAEGDLIRSIDLDGLEKYIVTARAFIPMPNLPNPAPWGSSKVKGDNREYYALNTTAYRTEQKVKVDFDNKTVSTFSNRANGSTGLDSKGNETNPPQHSDADIAGPLPTYDKPALDKGSATTIYLKVDAHDKLISGAPHINYDLAVTITPNVGADGKPMLDKEGNQTFDYQIKGIKDGFPAYELWITDEKSNKSYLLLHTNPKEAGKGPWSLWGTGDEKYNVKGNNSTQTPATKVKFSDTKNTPECNGDDCDK